MLRITRFLLIALMLVLLPLRGWAGDVMAVSMAASAVAQAKMGNITSQASMSEDCAMHAPQSTDDASAAYCDKCDTCELCLAVANLTPASRTAIKSARQTSPSAFNANFSSAARAPGFKPPIS